MLLSLADGTNNRKQFLVDYPGHTVLRVFPGATEPYMGGVFVQSTSFLQTQTILDALEFSLAKGGFNGRPGQKKTALRLIKTMKSTKSVSGRHRQLVGMLKKGASIDQMIGATGASRRTIFRYLNHFEDADIEIEIVNGKYRTK